MDQWGGPVALSWIPTWSGIEWPFLFTSPFLPVCRSIFSELFLSKGKKKVSLDSSSHVVAQLGVLMFGVPSLAGWHARSPACVCRLQQSRGLPLAVSCFTPFQPAAVSLAEYRNCFSWLRVAVCLSWKALTGRVNVMAKFVLAVSWRLSQISSKSSIFACWSAEGVAQVKKRWKMQWVSCQIMSV